MSSFVVGAAVFFKYLFLKNFENCEPGYGENGQMKKKDVLYSTHMRLCKLAEILTQDIT